MNPFHSNNILDILSLSTLALIGMKLVILPSLMSSQFVERISLKFTTRRKSHTARIFRNLSFTRKYTQVFVKRDLQNRADYLSRNIIQVKGNHTKARAHVSAPQKHQLLFSHLSLPLPAIDRSARIEDPELVTMFPRILVINLRKT